MGEPILRTPNSRRNPCPAARLEQPSDNSVARFGCTYTFLRRAPGIAAQKSTSRKGQTMASKQPNILILWGDDVGMWNISHCGRGMVRSQTQNSHRVAKEAVTSTAWSGQQSCTAGRAAFITGQNPLRTG